MTVNEFSEAIILVIGGSTIALVSYWYGLAAGIERGKKRNA